MFARLVLGLLLAGAATAGTAAAAPAGFRGTLSITHTFVAKARAPGVQSNVSGSGFHATYRLSGRRWRSRFAPPGSYLLTGRGHEELDLTRRDVVQGEGGTSALDFIARASGNVRLVAKANDPREASGLVLRLRPRGRFTLELTPLRGLENGLPLEFRLNREDSQSCVPTPGNRSGRQTYFRGVFEVHQVQACPDEEPADGSRIGREREPTIWGANVWSPPDAGFWQPDVCRGTVAALPVLRVCGRVRAGRMSGTSTVGGRNVVDGGRLGYPTRGICALFPRGGPGAELPPSTDGLLEACSRMDLGVDWHRRTVVRWNLRPAG